MPFNVSEEQSLLTSMISDRDAQISSLMHQLHSASELLHHTQREHQSQSASRKSQREEHTSTIQRLKEEHAEQRRILSKYEQSIKNGGGLRVHEYAALMRTANSSAVESSYVLRLQAQLCRAMHSLGVMESQLALVKDIFSGLIKFMKEDLSHMADDRTRREIELMNVLAKVDDEKRVMGMEMEKKVQEKEDLLDQVREEYEELGLEYDENEVKRALEVRYLLEQMEKVKEDKVRLEKELFAALLEREEQINRLKLENISLEEKLDGLKREEVDSEVGEENVLPLDTEGPKGEVGGSSSMDPSNDDQNAQNVIKGAHLADEIGDAAQTVENESGGVDEEVTPENTVGLPSDMTTQSDDATMVSGEALQFGEETKQTEEREKDVDINDISDAGNDSTIVTSPGEEIIGASLAVEPTSQEDEVDDTTAAAIADGDNEIQDKEIEQNPDQVLDNRAIDGLSEGKSN